MAERKEDSGFLEEVIKIRVHTKVTKGGRKLSFGALVAVGDAKGKIGLGYGRAAGVPMAIEKAVKEGRKDLRNVRMIGDTIAHEVMGRHGSSRVLLRPASPGTGVKASSHVRTIMDVVGVHNVLSKCFGPRNPVNVAKACLNALDQLRSPEEVESLRGVKITPFHPQYRKGTPQAMVEAGGEQDSEGVEAAQGSTG